MTTYLERALFVVGPQDSGKSVQLRSMFQDVRFGTKGVVPNKKRVPESHRLAQHRRLYLRLSSPQESGLTVQGWLSKVDQKLGDGRWCFAGALQPNAAGKAPDAATCISAFMNRFKTERIRCAILSSTWSGSPFDPKGLAGLLDRLQAVDGVEGMFIDPRSRVANGLLLADFFDFS